MVPSLVEAGPLWRELEGARPGVESRLPLFHRWAWVEQNRKVRHRLLTLRTATGDQLPCAAVQVERSVLPLHQRWRVVRFGHGLPPELWEPALLALADLSRKDAKVLRLTVNIFSREHRRDLAVVMERLGFRRAQIPQSYRHTLTIDLRPEVDEVLSGLHKTARKNLRADEKSSTVLRTITEQSYADRIGALYSESMHRTGRRNASLDWRFILQLSQSHPDLSRIAGLFASEAERGPEALIGFGWGCMHGDHGQYRAAGTTRRANTNLPLSYPLLWDLIQWAKRQGATWFDLGGVTLEGSSAEDPLSGISDFKRYFSRNVEEVGEDWVMEPHPGRAEIARVLQRGARASRDLLERMSEGANRIWRET